MRTHIFDSLLGAPPVTLATLRAPSSCLNSLSWPCSSLLLFSRSSCALSLAAQQLRLRQSIRAMNESILFHF